ncbi:hypothetical protein EYC84_003557 [Monilinia fructicola]|uniref:Uncharacterized protein n=1 Tax=Monilinia fructicola TaxID=38448 RepID=A0A5M9JU07_MONFR|nr:hypothetical protein EYC84_003557 [Monilinia fructicola]
MARATQAPIKTQTQTDKEKEEERRKGRQSNAFVFAKGGYLLVSYQRQDRITPQNRRGDENRRLLRKVKIGGKGGRVTQKSSRA